MLIPETQILQQKIIFLFLLFSGGVKAYALDEVTE